MFGSARAEDVYASGRFPRPREISPEISASVMGGLLYPGMPNGIPLATKPNGSDLHPVSEDRNSQGVGVRVHVNDY